MRWSFVFPERFPKRFRDRRRGEALALAPKAGDLLLATGNEFLTGRARPPIFEQKGNAALSEFAKPHSDDHFVERFKFCEVLTRNAECGETETVSQFGQNVRRVVAQEHFTRPSLPAQVAHIVDIPNEIGFLEADDVAVFICPSHLGDSL